MPHLEITPRDHVYPLVQIQPGIHHPTMLGRHEGVNVGTYKYMAMMTRRRDEMRKGKTEEARSHTFWSLMLMIHCSARNDTTPRTKPTTINFAA